MFSNPKSLVCWHCGIHLADIPQPIGRTAQCPQCRRDLHVCRMCRHYDRRYTSACSHLFADKVKEKDRVNFCSHFRARHLAYDPGEDRVIEASRAGLESLFGKKTPPAPEPPPNSRRESSQAAKDRARRALGELFGDDSE